MKKFIIFLMCLLTACNVSQPTQVQVNTEQELVGLQDIPLTNMPGHAPPETPLECICPKMFGLDHNPCCPLPKTALAPSPFKWYASPYHALVESKGEKTILVLFTRDINDADSFLASLLQPCASKVLDEHYVGLLLGDTVGVSDLQIEVGEETYDALRSTSELPLKWLPGDFFMSPSVMFVNTEKAPQIGEGAVLGRALPITYEGDIDANVCDLLEGMHTASQ